MARSLPYADMDKILPLSKCICFVFRAADFTAVSVLLGTMGCCASP